MSPTALLAGSARAEDVGDAATRTGLRVGVDVGGTFTKAVALGGSDLGLRAQAVVPTTHASQAGVTAGVVDALAELLAGLDADARDIALVAFSTTQAMNALLEGDVCRVGVVGLGRAPDLRPARKRTRVGEIGLAPGRSLRTEHEFLDTTGGLADEEIDGALERLASAGCDAVAVSGAFAVDAPAQERAVVARAARRGLPACAGHELSGAYGLETRTVSAAINAAILPTVERTATLVRRGLDEAGVEAPLLVLRGDGGAMSADAFRRRPSFTVGSGPAAGVAAALHRVGAADAIVIECGGTSTNVSVVRRGRPVLRSIRVMGRPTAIRSIDSWVVGAAGGSMALLGRRRVSEVGPRSAHVAGLDYACFAPGLRDAELELIAPQEGDPSSYAVVRAGEHRYALTVTCAANALGLVAPGTHASGSRESALEGFAALARGLRRGDAEAAARSVLDGALEKVAAAVADAARSHELDREVPLVALGGAAEAIVPELAARLGRPLLRPSDPEVLSSIGAAISLVRTEVSRSSADGAGNGAGARVAVAREAERACVDAGAAPGTVAVEASYEPDEGLVRAVATGAVALESGAATREPVAPEDRRAAAAEALGVDAATLELAESTDFYVVFGGGEGAAAVVDERGAVPLAEHGAAIVAGRGEELVERLRAAVEDASLNLGVVSMLPRVALLAGPCLLDLSDARRAEEIFAGAREALAEHPQRAVALVAR